MKGCNTSMQFYWKKKTIVSFVLALLVISIHNSAFALYALQLAGGGIWNEINLFLEYLAHNTVAQVAVPLFFILSGATLFRDYKKELYKKKLTTRFWSLIIPYFIWNVVGLCFDLFCAYTPISRFFIGREKFVVTLPNVIAAIFFYKSNGVFWFVYNLIVYTILTPLFDFFTKNKRRAYIFVAFALLLPLFGSRAFSAVKMEVSSVFFYAVGCIVGRYYLDDFIKVSSKRTRGICGVICLICMTFQMLNLYEVIQIHMIAKQVLLLIFCMAFWRVMDAVADRVELKPFMCTSFVLYAMHGDIQSIIVKIIYLIGPKEMWMGIPNYIISFCATVALICFISRCLKKFVPQVYAVLTGGR